MTKFLLTAYIKAHWIGGKLNTAIIYYLQSVLNKNQHGIMNGITNEKLLLYLIIHPGSKPAY